MEAALALTVAIIASVISAYVTVRLSIRQFHSQTWWDKKRETYAGLLRALSTLEYLYDQLIEEEFEGLQRSERYLARRNEYSLEAHLEIQRAGATGPFYISGIAADALRTVARALAFVHLDDPFEDLNSKAKACATAIAAIRTEAKADLKTKNL